jgi:adenosylhomocysteine nucleosidase
LKQRVGILGAMREEVSLLLGDLHGRRTRTIAGRRYHTGRLYGREAVLAFSGWGKVASASTATTLIEQCGARSVIFSGVAGAASASLRVGDVVIGREFIQHDLDARPIFKRFEVPLLGVTRFRANEPLRRRILAAATAYLSRDLPTAIPSTTRKAFGLTRPRVVSGLIASGDRFMSRSGDVRALRRLLPGLQCVEMEGAAVAQVCYEHRVPLAVIRVISDRADHSAGTDFARFLTSAARYYSRGILRRAFGSDSR